MPSLPNLLPQKIPNYLLLLSHQYQRTDQTKYQVLKSSRVFIDEDASPDNWNGGSSGHDVYLFVPVEILALIDIDDKSNVEQQLRDDLKKLSTNFETEYVNRVWLELNDETDINFKRASGFSAKSKLNPDTIGIWKPDHIRVFISHRDAHKSKAQELATKLEAFRISCFVAHKNIEADKEWRKEIIAGLETMEAMLVFLTDDFHDSPWTMQEVGYALGKGIPWLSLKLEKADPPGFINHKQALRGAIDKPTANISDIFKKICDLVGQPEKVQDALVSTFVGAGSFANAGDAFKSLEAATNKLSPSNLEKIIKNYASNSQLHNCTYLLAGDRMTAFLHKTTGKSFQIKQRVLSEILPTKPSIENDLPF